MPDPLLPQLTVWPVTGTELVTVAVQVVLLPTGAEAGSHVIVVWVSAGFVVVGLKLADIVPSPFRVAFVEAEEGSANAMADGLLTVQPENA